MCSPSGDIQNHRGRARQRNLRCACIFRLCVQRSPGSEAEGESRRSVWSVEERFRNCLGNIWPQIGHWLFRREYQARKTEAYRL